MGREQMMKDIISNFFGIFNKSKKDESKYFTAQFRRNLYERFSHLLIEDFFGSNSVINLANSYNEGKFNKLALEIPLSGETVLKVASFMESQADKNILKKRLTSDKTLTIRGLVRVYYDIYDTVESAKKREAQTREWIREVEKREADEKAKALLESL